jgi:hypothetical protein
MRILFPALLMLVLLSSAGCNIINPPEQIPTYVRIDSFSVSGDPAVTGSNSHKITSAFVYFNNAPVGIFDLPASFPLIADKPGTLTILPGVDFDGLSGYQVVYPLYLGDTMSLTPSPGVEQHFDANTKYIQGAGLQSNDEFEQGVGFSNTFQKLSGDTTIVNTANPADVFEGHGSGIIALGSHDSATIISRNGIAITTNKNTYIELNYRSNCPIWVGMSVLLSDGSRYNEYIVGLNKRDDWGKIYIGADDFIGPHQGTDYKIIIHTERPSTVANGVVNLDNIKIINFKN